MHLLPDRRVLHAGRPRFSAHLAACLARHSARGAGRRFVRCAALALTLATAIALVTQSALAAAPKAARPSTAPAPSLGVGDEWTYTVNSRDERTVASSVETRRVTATAGHVTVRIERKGRGVDMKRTESFSSPGVVTSGAACGDETRRFPTGLTRLDFPLHSGKRWSRRVQSITSDTGRKGTIAYRGRVFGWEKVTTPAGTFDALRVTVYVRLDDGDAKRQGTECDSTLWYAPDVRGVVLEERRASYAARGDDSDATDTLDASYELVNFTPGKSR